MNVSTAEIGYVAGIIDGEGNIGLNIMESRGVYPVLQISNSSLELCEWLRNRLGGHISKRKWHKGNDNWKPGYTLCINSPSRMRNILPLVEPFLIVKRNQARLMLGYLAIRTDRRKLRQLTRDSKGRITRAYPAPIPPIEQDYVRKMHELNRRGL